MISLHSAEGPPLFFWDARPILRFSNFGDALSEALVERIIGHEVTIAKEPFEDRKLLGMGSIMSYARTGDLIWGTGVNGKEKVGSYLFSSLDARAVRGPKTREFLLKRGIPCPEVYGDPTLLLPQLFPEFKKAEEPIYEYVIIPHFSDEAFFAGNPNLVSVKEPWTVVVEKILQSKLVVSSALSGIIVAEAFGIPARLLQLENAANTEDLFKYEDYYLGSGRQQFVYAKSLAEALKLGGEPPFECDLIKLRDSFPIDAFSCE
jgi:pyruvyltransferase